MTSSISWIDREGLEETLARIGARGRRLPAVDGPSTEAADPEEPHPVVQDAPKLASVPAPAAETDAGVISEFLPPSGPLRQRLEAFMAWLVKASGSQAAFIVDRDGLPLVDRSADPDLLAVAASIMRLVESINHKLLFPVGRAVTLEIEGGQLSLMSVDTSIGRYIVGQVGDQPIGRALRDAATEALQRAFQPGAEQQAVGS